MAQIYSSSGGLSTATLLAAMEDGLLMRQCVHQLVSQRAEQMPDAMALVFEEQRLTYRELEDRSNRLAEQLRGWGVGPEVRVGIGLTRSLEMVIGLLAVLKAGGAYVPIDPGYPRERVAFMLEDAGVQVLLTQQSLRDHFRFPNSNFQVVCVDELEGKRGLAPSLSPLVWE